MFTIKTDSCQLNISIFPEKRLIANHFISWQRMSKYLETQLKFGVFTDLFNCLPQNALSNQ